MFGYAVKRLLSTIPVLWIALTFCFFVLRLAPGGPFDLERPLPPIVRANLEAHYGLDRSLVEQYFSYMGNVLIGDLGPSFTNDDFTVAELLAVGLPYTFTIGGAAFLLAIALGVLTGTFSALHRNSGTDYALAAVVMTGLIVPNFLVAPIL